MYTAHNVKNVIRKYKNKMVSLYKRKFNGSITLVFEDRTKSITIISYL